MKFLFYMFDIFNFPPPKQRNLFLPPNQRNMVSESVAILLVPTVYKVRRRASNSTTPLASRTQEVANPHLDIHNLVAGPTLFSILRLINALFESVLALLSDCIYGKSIVQYTNVARCCSPIVPELTYTGLDSLGFIWTHLHSHDLT